MKHIHSFITTVHAETGEMSQYCLCGYKKKNKASKSGKKKTAFDCWLKDNSSNNPNTAAEILSRLLMQNPSHDNVVWDLLEQTGDSKYTPETFLKAAKISLNREAA